MAGALTAADAPAGARIAAVQGRPAVLVVVLAFVLFTFGLGTGALWDQDEAKYTEVAREIVERGDPITLHVNGQPWFVHPPLYMWLQAATGALFGFTEFAARIWSALFGVLGVLATYLIARRLYDSRTGVIAALILMTMLEYFALSRLAIFDVALVTFMLLALYMVLVGEDAQAAGRPGVASGAYRWAFMWAGLATLTKGPIGLLLPALIVSAWWILLGVWRRRVRHVPWDGILIYGAIGLSWYVAEAIIHGGVFLRSVVGYYMVTRFVGVVENQAGPWYYYLPVLIVGAFPWSAFLPSAVVYHARRVRADSRRGVRGDQRRAARRDRRSLLLLVWIGITLLFYSAAGTKLPNYIMPVFPIAAIAIARPWAKILGDPDHGESLSLVRWGFRGVLAALAALVAAVLIFGRWQYPGELAALRLQLLAPAVVLAAGLAVAAAFFAGGRPQSSLVTLVLTMVMVCGIVVLYVLPRVEALRPMKRAALMIHEQVRPEDRVVEVSVNQTSSLLFYVHHPVIWAFHPDAVRRAVCGPGRVFVVTNAEEYPKLAAALPALGVAWRERDVVVLRTTRIVSCAPA